MLFFLRPHDVILFMVGGATYEGEHRCWSVIRMINKELSFFIFGPSFLQLTYDLAEARTVALLNSQGSAGPGGGARFLLGGSCIHNSSSFLDLIQDSASRFPSSIANPPPVGTGSAPLNLSIGPVQLAVGGGRNGNVAEGVGAMSNQLLDPERLGDAADGAKQLATDLFGRLRRGVEGISLQ